MTGTVGVVGLGAMGLGMARTLRRAGFAVHGFDPSEARRALAAEDGIRPVSSQDALSQPVVVASLPTARHVESVVEGDNGFLAHAAQGAVLIDTSTSEASVSRRLAAACADRGLGFLDAPVSGGRAGAEAGTLTMMVGGEPLHLERAEPVLSALAGEDRVFHVGGPGAGNVAKLVNNLLVGAHLMIAGEAVRIAAAAGVPAGDLLAVVNAATGRSAATELNMPRWILSGSYDSGFTAGLMRKDIALAEALRREVEVAAPLAEAVAALWAASADTLSDGDDFNRIATP